MQILNALVQNTLRHVPEFDPPYPIDENITRSTSAQRRRRYEGGPGAHLDGPFLIEALAKRLHASL